MSNIFGQGGVYSSEQKNKRLYFIYIIVVYIVQRYNKFL